MTQVIRYHVNPNKFNKIDNADAAYWLGFLYADGCMSDNSRIGVMLKDTDTNHLEKLQNFLEWDGHIKHRVIGKYQRCELVFRCKPMFNDLLNLGCHPRKSYVLNFPQPQQVSDDFLFDFIRGYVDGDGSVGKLQKNNCYYPRLSICGRYNFIDNLIIRSEWKRNKILIRPNGLSTIEWQGKYAKQFAHQLYDNATVYLNRKYDIVSTLPF